MANRLRSTFGKTLTENNLQAGEPPRVFRRLYSVRGWSHEKSKEVFPGGQGEIRSYGV